MERIGVEIERKYIIKIPKISDMSSLDGYTASDIVQIYLTSQKGVTRRIRSRCYGEITEYFETEKRRIDAMSATEHERSISAEEFSALTREQKADTKAIIKRRYTFRYFEQLFEIDVYPEWTSTCIMETELPSRDAYVKMPEFIEIVREVTGDKAYSNASMSRAFPPE